MPKQKTEEASQVEVVAQAKSQPPVTNQTPLMHLYGRHSQKPRRSNGHLPYGKQATKRLVIPGMHRAMRHQSFRLRTTGTIARKER